MKIAKDIPDNSVVACKLVWLRFFIVFSEENPDFSYLLNL